MAKDLMAQFRGGRQEPRDTQPQFQPQPQPRSQAQPQPQAGLERYEAFETKDRPSLSLELRPLGKNRHFPAYRYMGDMELAEDNSWLILYFLPLMMVTVRGRNLNEGVMGLAGNRTTLIRQFDPEKHAVPGEKEALVESIEILPAKGLQQGREEEMPQQQPGRRIGETIREQELA